MPLEKMTNRLKDKCLQLVLCGGYVKDWMDIPVISIPLDHIYCLSVDGQELQPVEKWRERVVLPEVLSMLESFCVKQGIQDFGAFSDACNMILDRSLAMAFTPINNS